MTMQKTHGVRHAGYWASLRRQYRGSTWVVVAMVVLLLFILIDPY